MEIPEGMNAKIREKTHGLPGGLIKNVENSGNSRQSVSST